MLILHEPHFIPSKCCCFFNLVFQEARICMPVPLYHCFGMVLGCLQVPCHGATVVFPSQAFDAGLSLQAAQAERSLCVQCH